MPPTPLSVAVLAGGQSRRMGRDKALLSLRGRALLDHVLERVSGLGDDLFVVATDRPDYARLGVRVVPDLLAGRGALGGIHTAISTARHPYCLVVACDMPFLSPELLTYMAALPRDFDVLVPTLDASRSNQGGSQTFETLHAIYGSTCLPAIERRLARGDLKVVDLLRDVRCRTIPESTIRRHDPELLSFVNANTPTDLDQARDRDHEAISGAVGDDSDAGRTGR
ncbi:MAG TPA: molybdenum cofactor guanylyltransferase [Thermomicrobiaceae bacterium]|nr:molybdenum cofactor guanylyltransferase [Thermomicrobiaceae bacterium]